MTDYNQDWFRKHAVPRLHDDIPVEAIEPGLPALRSDEDLNRASLLKWGCIKDAYRDTFSGIENICLATRTHTQPNAIWSK